MTIEKEEKSTTGANKATVTCEKEEKSTTGTNKVTMTCEKDEISTTGANKATLSCEIDEISKQKNNSLQLIDLSEVNNECNDEGINDSIITLGEIKLPTTSNNNSNQDSIEDNGTETAKGNSVYENIDMDDGEEEYTKIIKVIRGGTTYEIMYCSFCGKMITNHYCSALVPGSKIRFVERQCACYIDPIGETLKSTCPIVNFITPTIMHYLMPL